MSSTGKRRHGEDNDLEEEESDTVDRQAVESEDARTTKKSRTGLDDDEVENQVDQVEPPVQAVQRIPRQWQLSDADIVRCLQSYACWKMRLASFVRLPVLSVEDDTAEMREERLVELRYLANELYAIWTMGCSASTAPQSGVDSGAIKADPMGIAYALFFHRVVDVNLSPGAVDSAMVPLSEDVNELINLHRRYRYCANEPEHNASMSMVNNVRYALQNAYRMLHHAASLTIAVDPSKAAIEPSKNVLYQVDNFNYFQARMKDAKPFAKLISYLVAVAAQRRYRRHRDSVYEEHITEEGYATSYWKQVCTMREFILTALSKEQAGFEIWDMAMGQGVKHIKACEEYLGSMYDSEFPFISIDRHVFSFRNGIYFCATRTFRPYTSGALDWGVDSHINALDDIDRDNMARKRGFFGTSGCTNASANYFNVEFNDYNDQVRANPDFWFEGIQTPAFSKLMDDQNVPIPAQKVVYGLVGRLFYEVGELDDWQIILWFLGYANSGKSTICKVAQLFYQPEDVAVISNNIEEQFGLGSVYDKLIFMAPEVKKDFRLNQAEFQSMVSGEKMSIARKFKDAAGVMFKVPGLLAGNDMPNWMDNSHSVVRRIALVHFAKTIVRVDGEIKKRLREQVGELIAKCNIAYHMMLESYGSKGVWENLPAYFHKTQNNLKAKTHPMYHFLKSEQLVFGKDHCIALEDFKALFNDHVRKNNLKRVAWTEELYEVPLYDHKLVQEMREEFRSGDKIYKHATVIVGVAARDAVTATYEPPAQMPNYEAPSAVGPKVGSYQPIPQLAIE